MNISHCDFTNENGETIGMIAFEDRNGITVTVHNPKKGYNEYTMDRKEASVLVGLLNQIGVKRDRKPRRLKK